MTPAFFIRKGTKMKDIIALLVFIVIATITFYLVYSKKIAPNFTIIFLGFSIVAGLAIANYDVKRLKWKSFELETFTEEIGNIKDKAIEDIQKEVASQKEIIALVMKNVNNTGEKLDEQNKSLEELLKKATVTTEEMNNINTDLINTKKDIEIQQEAIQKIINKGEHTRNDIEALYKTIKELSLITTKINWLYVETKNEFGTDRDMNARNAIMGELNRLLPMILSNPRDRETWIKELQKSLPPRK